MISNVVYYLKSGLAATPIVLERLSKDDRSEIWDMRPDPERFTLREAMAHLADWEAVWMERITRIREENKPFLPSYDEGQWAIDHDYSNTIIGEQIDKFIAGRNALVTVLEDLTTEEWSRVGTRDELGQISIFELTVLILGHDGYHLRQLTEYLDLK